MFSAACVGLAMVPLVQLLLCHLAGHRFELELLTR
jgi:hypothetical protein